MKRILTFVAVAFAAAMLWVAPAAANQVTRVADATSAITFANGGISIEIGNGHRRHDRWDRRHDRWDRYDRYDRRPRCYDDWGYRVPCYQRRPPVVVPFPFPLPIPGPHGGHHNGHGHHRR